MWDKQNKVEETNKTITPCNEETKNGKTNALISKIEESIPILEKYPSVVERYFTTMYCLSINDKPIDHQIVLFHSNRICLLTIAPSHPCLKLKKTISRINCAVGKQNRWDNKVTGKGKKGGQKLEPNTVLCVIETNDGDEYKFYSTVKGRLLEINDALQENPNLLIGFPNTKGFIAVVLSDLSTVEMHKQHMLQEEEYRKLIEEEETKIDQLT